LLTTSSSDREAREQVFRMSVVISNEVVSLTDLPLKGERFWVNVSTKARSVAYALFTCCFHSDSALKELHMTRESKKGQVRILSKIGLPMTYTQQPLNIHLSTTVPSILTRPPTLQQLATMKGFCDLPKPVREKIYRMHLVQDRPVKFSDFKAICNCSKEARKLVKKPPSDHAQSSSSFTQDRA
jgi:hypothetical protein